MAKSSLDKMKERLKKSSPKISGRMNLENMNQIRNFVFGKKKAMGVDDDVLGIATQKAKKNFKRFVNTWMSNQMEYNKTKPNVVTVDDDRIERERLAFAKKMDEAEKDAASDEERADITKQIGDLQQKIKGYET